jgi:hypothetical protein
MNSMQVKKWALAVVCLAEVGATNRIITTKDRVDSINLLSQTLMPIEHSLLALNHQINLLLSRDSHRLFKDSLLMDFRASQYKLRRCHYRLLKNKRK